MSRQVNKATGWIYNGIWEFVVRWFKVPAAPPTLPISPNQDMKSFRPAEGYLKYLKFEFWIVLFIIDMILVLGWIVLLSQEPFVAYILAPLTLLLILVPNILVYIGIHLKYDTTWYVLTNRSIRIRRGIWDINEMTFTFENVQNVSVKQGPLQRCFGISNVLVETAGGGGSHEQQGPALTHLGRIDGVSNGPEIRDLILNQLRKSRQQGLGDESPNEMDGSNQWIPEHVRVLKSIRDALK